MFLQRVSRDTPQIRRAFFLFQGRVFVPRVADEERVRDETLDLCHDTCVREVVSQPFHLLVLVAVLGLGDVVSQEVHQPIDGQDIRCVARHVQARHEAVPTDVQTSTRQIRHPGNVVVEEHGHATDLNRSEINSKITVIIIRCTNVYDKWTATNHLLDETEGRATETARRQVELGLRHHVHPSGTYVIK